MPASLSDSNILGTNSVFLGRVQGSLLAACVAIAAEGLAVLLHPARMQLVHQILASPTSLTSWSTIFALAVATDTTVLADATAAGTVVLTGANVLTQQALVTDAHINTAVSARYNAFCPGIAD